MRAFVFTDRALAEQAGRFVWLALDTEKSKNAPLRKRFPFEALPTFLILDPVDEHVVMRWVGGATVPQLQKLLADGGAAVAANRAGETPGAGATADAADRALTEAERLYGEGKNAEAAKAYGEALAAAPEGWSHYARAVESRLFALQQSDGSRIAALLARDAFPRLASTPSAANVAATGLSCALELPAEDSLRAGLARELETDCRRVIADSTLAIAADDRSAVFISLLDARKDAKDDAGAHQVAREWSDFLDGEARRAKRPDQRMVFDSHRLAAYLELGEPERALPMLEASEKDAPDDYNPPARLALAYNAMKRWSDAIAATDRALSRAYGPRKLRILTARAEAYQGAGDTVSAKRTMEEAVALAESLPPGQRSEATIASLRKKLVALQ